MRRRQPRPSEVVDAWGDELEAIVAVGGLFDLTMYPFISGRPARVAALETLIRRAQSMDGVWVAAGDEIRRLGGEPRPTAGRPAPAAVVLRAAPGDRARAPPPDAATGIELAPVRRQPSTPMTVGGITPGSPCGGPWSLGLDLDVLPRTARAVSSAGDASAGAGDAADRHRHLHVRVAGREIMPPAASCGPGRARAVRAARYDETTPYDPLATTSTIPTIP